MDSLLSHPGFRLIFIDDNGNMSLILPLEHKEDIIENGYRCISHLWGDATKWEDHGVENITWGVCVREEKREKLLQIFNHFKGYFWMDVFCTNQDSSNKPLSIMGDVYRYCKECICLLDIKIPDIMDQLPKLSNIRAMRLLADHTIKVAECKWNKRVWTFQEWMLPPKILYTTEIFEEELCMMDPEVINKAIDDVIDNSASWIIALGSMAHKWSRTMSASTVFERKQIKNEMIYHLIRSGRECKNPEDYYYGIAGVLKVPLTDGLSFLEVEKEFLAHINADEPIITKIESKDNNVYKTWESKGILRIIMGNLE